MNSKFSVERFFSQDEYAYQCFIQGDYPQAANLYKQAIDAEPDVKSHYWYLGLSLLLQGQEVEAQTTWFMAIMEGEPDQVELWNDELVSILQAEAERWEKISDNSTAYLLRLHIQEIQPKTLENLLHIIQLVIKLNKFSGDDLNFLKLLEILKSKSLLEINAGLLIQVLQEVLECAPLHQSSLEFAEACLPHLENIPQFFAILLVTAIKIAYSLMKPTQAVQVAELCLQIDAEDLELLRHLSAFYQNAGNYLKGIETAKKCYSLLETEALVDRVFANHLLLRGLINSGGYCRKLLQFYSVKNRF